MQKIWLNSYPADVPHEINPEQYTSLLELFLTSCKKYHNLPAFSNMGIEMSYAELDKHTLDFAAYLQQELKGKVIECNFGDRFFNIL